MSTSTWKEPIYFSLDEIESIAEEEATVTLTYIPPIILPEEFPLETDLSTPECSSAPLSLAVTPIPRSPTPAKGVSPLVGLLGSLGLLLISMLLIDTYHFIAQQYANSLFLGTLFSFIILSIVTTTFVLTWRTYQNIKKFHTVTKLQHEGQLLIEKNQHGNAVHYLNKISDFYKERPDIKTRLDRFYIVLNDAYSDRDVCHLFSVQVMADLDQQAYRLVAQRSKETALMVMISQVALVDTLLTLWRNVHLIYDIASLYGNRPSFLGSLNLITSVLKNMVYADVSEVIADTTAEILGGSLLSIMSAQVAQGLGSGILTARVGLQTMQACRPLPFLENEKPSLKAIRGEIVSSLKGLFQAKLH